MAELSDADGNVIARSYSEKYLPGAGDVDLMNNQNQNWSNTVSFKLSYLFGVLMVWFFLHVTQVFTPEDCWTTTNMIHFVITFVLFHWVKGSPDESTGGEYYNLTLYEQIDAGVAWTNTKKLLMLVPSVLTLTACHFADYKPIYVIVNSAIFLVVIIAKIPEMHKIRLFGINSVPEPVVIERERSDDSMKATASADAATPTASPSVPKKRNLRSATKKAK